MTYQLRVPSIVKGIGTRIPLIDRLANASAGSRVGSRYFYSVWLRHLVKVQQHSPAFRFDVVGELGPGDAMGLGLCALLSGARRYVGLDRIAFAPRADNLGLLVELHALFAARAPIPDDQEFPRIYPRLESYDFPHHILDEARLAAAAAPERLMQIRTELAGKMDAADGAMLGYAAPWDAQSNVQAGTVDLLLSQAVMEHVDDVESAYANMHRWLKPDGVMSHRIDYSCHGITRDWFGHWLVSDRMWRLARGRRAYFINRLPHSAHITSMQRHGFRILAIEATTAGNAAPPLEMRVSYHPKDLNVTGALVIARPASDG